MELFSTMQENLLLPNVDYIDTSHPLFHIKTLSLKTNIIKMISFQTLYR